MDLGHFDAARGTKVTKVGVLRGADAGLGNDGERIGARTKSHPWQMRHLSHMSAASGSPHRIVRQVVPATLRR